MAENGHKLCPTRRAPFRADRAEEVRPETSKLPRRLDAAPRFVRAIPEVRMVRRTIKLVTFVLVATLLLSSECYAGCAVSACATLNAPSSHCHHHSERSKSSADSCQHRH